MFLERRRLADPFLNNQPFPERAAGRFLVRSMSVTAIFQQLHSRATHRLDAQCGQHEPKLVSSGLNILGDDRMILLA